MQSKVCSLRSARHSAAVPAVTVSTSWDVSSFATASRCMLVVLHDQHPAHLLGKPLLQLAHDLHQLLAQDGLDRVADRAERKGRLGVIGCRDDVDRNVARLDVALELIEDRQSGLVGQGHVENDGARHEPPGERHGLFGRARHQRPEAHFARQVAQNGGEGGVVLDHEEDASRVGRQIAVVVHLADRLERVDDSALLRNARPVARP